MVIPTLASPPKSHGNELDFVSSQNLILDTKVLGFFFFKWKRHMKNNFIHIKPGTKLNQMLATDPHCIFSSSAADLVKV